jgi:hypothetical protein
VENGGGLVLARFPPTVQQLQATIGPTPVVYRVEDAHTYKWREPTEAERLRVRAWHWRFGERRGCSPTGTHPVHRVGVVFFRPVGN